MQLTENTTKPINEEANKQDRQGKTTQSMLEVERRIAYLQAVQDFQLMAKKRSRPFWKKMLSIK